MFFGTADLNKQKMNIYYYPATDNTQLTRINGHVCRPSSSIGLPKARALPA